MRISSDQVERIAQLARLHLEDDERERIRGDLQGILEHVGRLDEVDVDEIDPMHNPAESDANVLRDDIVVESGVSDGFLESVPRRDDRYVTTPRFVDPGSDGHG